MAATMDPSLCTQPPEITDHSPPTQHVHTTNGAKKKRKSKLKSHRQQPPPPSPSAEANYPVSPDQVAAALAASRARVARSSGRPTADEAAAASASVDLVDLTGSSPPRPRGAEKGANSEVRGKSAENSLVTPTPVAAREEIAVESLPPAPKLSTSSAPVQARRLKVRDDNFVSRVSMEGMQAARVAVEKRMKSSRVAETEEDGKSLKKARVSLDAEKTSGTASAERVVEQPSAQPSEATKTTQKASSTKKSKAASRVSIDAADNATSKSSESVKTNESTQSMKPASKLSKAVRVSLDGENKTTSNGSETVEAVEPSIQATKPASKASKAARVSLDGADKTTSKGSASIEQSATSHKQKNNTISGTNPNKSSSPQTKSSPATVTKSPPKTKKRSFHDQILYTMLTTSRPYSIKSLAKACDTTTAALHHAMLSFLDKQLVISKEFPSKKGEPKKLYWANPLSLNELNGKSALCKEMGKLLASPEEIGEAEKRHKQLQLELRGIMEELNPLLAVPTLKQMDEQILQEESELNKIQAEVHAIRARTESAAKPKPQRVAHGRFQKPSQPLDKPTLKRKINRALSEYKERKRKCMDFVENLADAMEKKVKDVASEKVLGLETDEAEWGCWVDEATGKVFGAAKKGKKSGGEEEGPAVKIPAKYTDV